MSTPERQQIGVVVIGRNEGERLKRCLASLESGFNRIVYVDSGSTDGSIEHARSLGVDVVNLDMTVPFTMARGRNAGFRRLAESERPPLFVQFIDGDCEVVEGFVELAAQTLHERPEVAAVCGWRRERFPEASVYNRLADMEWRGPVGEIPYTGGDVMMRLSTLTAVGGFNERMIAGEEPELCVRLRMAGGKILRLGVAMTLHDAAMTRFSQWWRRAKRGGHAYAEGAALHGRGPFRHNVRQVRSALVWGLVVPAAAIAMAALAVWIDPRFWIAIAIVPMLYVLLGLKVWRSQRRAGWPSGDAARYACFTLMAKFAQVAGIALYWRNRLLRRKSRLIEYKTSDASAAPPATQPINGQNT